MTDEPQTAVGEALAHSASLHTQPDSVETVARLQALLDPKTRPADPKVEAISSGHLKHAETVTCADGFTMSVQASRFHYCSPRDSHGPWYAVEVGFPSAKVEAFMPFIDGQDEDPTGTVYGYVPLEIVAQAVIDHGGFVADANSASPSHGGDEAEGVVHPKTPDMEKPCGA